MRTKLYTIALGILVCSATGLARADTATPAAGATVTPASTDTDAALSGRGATRRTQFTWALDPYDSNLAFDFPLGDRPITTLQSEDPSALFRGLMDDSLLPHYMFVQGDVYPLPILGTWLKANSPHTYKKADLQNTGVNLVESSTASYQEPWRSRCSWATSPTCSARASPRAPTTWATAAGSSPAVPSTSRTTC